MDPSQKFRAGEKRRFMDKIFLCLALRILLANSHMVNAEGFRVF